MIKESTLIGTKVPAPWGWHEFKVGDLFNVSGTHGFDKGDIVLSSHGTEFIGRTETNNGVQGFYDDPFVAPNEANTISISQIGAQTAQYRKSLWYASQNLFKLLPKFDMKERHALFLIGFINKGLSIYSGYSHFPKIVDIVDMQLLLPVAQDDQPDYGWMASYIRELENQRIRELETYLQVTGLSDTILSVEEKAVLDKWRQHEKFGGGTLSTKGFLVGDLFDIMSTHALNYDLLQPNGDYPYVVRSAQNNGIREFMNYDKAFLNEGNVITLGIDTASYFYQATDFFAGVKVKSLRLKYHELNPRIALFLISVLQKKAGDYGYAGGKAFKTAELAEVLIELPVTNDDMPDYNFMQTFIKAQEKLLMQRLDKFRQVQIDTTKAVI